MLYSELIHIFKRYICENGGLPKVLLIARIRTYKYINYNICVQTYYYINALYIYI